jgi:hypothetical protein
VRSWLRVSTGPVRGYWATNEIAAEDDVDDPMPARVTRVIPFVEDRRNCLLIEPIGSLAAPVMASLAAALKSAIQVRYQLEDSELAVEPLPDDNNRRLLLLYESAEGGAGVLRNLLDEPLAIQDVARKALEICHYDPLTGDDKKRAPRAKEDCEAACYDCLMNYGNQRDHKLLDSKANLWVIKSETGRLQTLHHWRARFDDRRTTCACGADDVAGVSYSGRSLEKDVFR